MMKALGFLMTLLGLLVMVGWHTGSSALVQIFPSFAPMQYNAALGFLCLGLGAFFYKYRYAGLVFIPVAWTLGLLTLIEYIFDWNIGLDELFMDHNIVVETSHPGRMAPNTALCFVIISTCIYLQYLRIRPFYRMAFGMLGGALVIGFGLISLAGYALGMESAYGWGNYTRMAVHTSLGFVLTGLSLAYGVYQTHARSAEKENLLSVMTFIGYSTFAAILWQVVIASETMMIHRYVEKNRDHLEVSLREHHSRTVNALNRMAGRLAHYGISETSQWQTDAENYVKDQPWYKMIVLLGPDYEIVGVAPRSRYESLEALASEHDFSKYPTPPIALATRKPATSNTQGTLAEGDVSFAVVIPFFKDDVIAGFVVGAYDLQAYLDVSAAEYAAQGFNVSASNNGEMVYRARPYDEKAGDQGQFTTTIDIPTTAQEWTIYMNPRPELIRDLRTSLPTTILLSGLILSALLVIAIHFWRKSSQRMKTLEEVQHELQASEARYRAVIDKLPDVVVTTDTKGTVLTCSPNVEAMYGYKPEEIIGTTDHILRPGDMDTAYREERQQIWHDLGTNHNLTPLEVFKDHYFEAEAMWHKKDGSPLPIRVRTTQLDVTGPARFCGIFTDLTEQRAYEEDLRAAREKAEAANKAKSEFLANMSHEIRTPMNGIMGLNHLLQGMGLRKEAQLYLDKIAASSEALLNILNDILDYSKIEANKLDISPHSFELGRVVRNVHDLFFAQTTDKHLEFEVSLPDDLPGWYVGDSLRISQVLNNLMGNAIKFTKEGKVSLKAEVHQKGQDEFELQFEVSDTGIGISKDQVEQLFQPFTQADGSITRQFGGTGLGLSISKRLAELMHGDLQVVSKEGKGTTFIFTVPVTAATDEMKPVEDAHLIQEHEGIPFEGVKILVAEDNQTNQLVARGLLGKFGLKPVIVDNGQIAVDTFEKQDFDLILMDLHMPVLDGFEATRVIRKTEKGRDIPIIAMTAAAMETDKESAFKAGMNAHISKPIDADILFNTIASFIVPQMMQMQGATTLEPLGDQAAKLEDEFEIEGLDLKLAVKSLMDNWDLLAELTEGFYVQFKDIVPVLEAHRDAGEWDSVRAINHSIAGSAGSVGATHLSNLSKDADRHFKAGETPDINAVIVELANVLAALSKHFQRETV